MLAPGATAANPAKPGLFRRIGSWLAPFLKLRWLVALAALTLVVSLVISASHSRGVVIERLEIDEALAPDGLKGPALAARVLHRLTRMRAATRSLDSDHALAEVPDPAWLDDFRVEIPETGIAVGDVYKILRRWFGHDTYMRGEIYRAPDPEKPGEMMVAITVWTNDEAHTYRLAGGKEQLVTETAERFYQRAYPYLHAMYLREQPGRDEEVRENLRSIAFKHASRKERALAMNALGAIILEDDGQCDEAIDILLRANELDPWLPSVFANLSNAYYCLGRDEQSLQASRRELDALRRLRGELVARRRPKLQLEHEATVAGQYGDYRRRLELYERMERDGFGDKAADRAMTLADNHDLRGYLRVTGRNFDRASITETRFLWMQFKFFWALEDWDAAARKIDEVNDRYKKAGAYVAKQVKTQNRPLEAIALAWAGKTAAAREVLNDMPPSCYLCARADAIVTEAEAGRQRPGTAEEKRLRQAAGRKFIRAIDLAPRLPFAYAEYARALAARGDTAGARHYFAEAHRLAPGWADPLKGWGDALLAERDLEGARAKYEEAAERAPQWGALYIEWGKSLWHSGERERALAMFRQAQSIGLSVRDGPRARAWEAFARAQLKANRPTSGGRG